MTIDEAIRCLSVHSSTNGSGLCTDEQHYEAKQMAIKALEQQNTWIPVSERAPEEGKTVIASTEYGVYPETRFTKEYGWEWAYEAGADYWRELKDVLAWMPLPEPYKVESEDIL